jgi:hypothetical protein
MSIEYIKHIFEIEDGKVSFEKLGQKKRGRKPGYSHSSLTKTKIAEKMKNRIKTEEIKKKISKSLKGRSKPDEVKEKISLSKLDHNVGKDLRFSYGLRVEGSKPPTDRLRPDMTTLEWIQKCGHDLEEIQEWIIKNYAEFNKIANDVKTESYLEAIAIKEETPLESDRNKDDWK